MSKFFFDAAVALETHMKRAPIDICIEYENTIFTPKSKEWAKISIMPGSTEQVCMGKTGQDLTTGICQIDVFVPLGAGASDNLDIIADHFSRKVLTENETTVHILDVSQEASIKENGYMRNILSITYRINTAPRSQS